MGYKTDWEIGSGQQRGHRGSVFYGIGGLVDC